MPPRWSEFGMQRRLRHKRVAADFLTFMQERAGAVNADAVHDWLLQRLKSHAVGTVREDLRCLGRLLRSDAVQCWRKRCDRKIGCVVAALHSAHFDVSSVRQGPLGELIPEFVRWRESLRRGSRAEIALRRLDRFLAARGVTSIGAIDARLLAAFLQTRRVAAKTMNIEIRALQQFFRWLRRTERLLTNPDAFLKPPPQSRQHRPYIFSLKEVAILLQALRAEEGWDGLTAFTMLHLIYACGLRISEATHLRLVDVDTDNRILQIRQTKFGKSRQIPIGRRVAEYLASYRMGRQQRLEGLTRRGGEPAAGRFFINSYGRAVKPFWLRDRFRRACQDTGLNRNGRWMRVHDMRHSFAVHRLYKWYAEGIDPQSKLLLLSFYMGHVLIENTSYYLQMGQDLMRVASRQCARGFDEALRFYQEPAT